MFQNFPLLPLDPIFQLQADYLKDQNTKKVNLGIGLYADNNGNPVVLETIKKTFNEVDQNDFNYQPIGGNLKYLELTAKLLLGNPDLNNLALQATCGGTQAVRMFADLVEQEARSEGRQPELVIGVPTWGNHLAICKNFKITKFEHLSEGLASYTNHRSALEAAADHSMLLIHGGRTHNPSGQNLTTADWLNLADIINAKKIRVLIDAAYFGFGDTFEQETANLKAVFDAYENVAIAFSYSKNASLYEHRTGALIVKTNNKLAVQSQLQQLARESVSMAPGLGQEIMLNVLSNKLSAWQQEVDQIRISLDARRKDLISRLPMHFGYLLNSAGMFGLLPFTATEIEVLKTEHSIYFPANGRINFAGINPANLDYLIEKFSN